MRKRAGFFPGGCWLISERLIFFALEVAALVLTGADRKYSRADSHLRLLSLWLGSVVSDLMGVISFGLNGLYEVMICKALPGAMQQNAKMRPAYSQAATEQVAFFLMHEGRFQQLTVERREFCQDHFHSLARLTGFGQGMRAAEWTWAVLVHFIQGDKAAFLPPNLKGHVPAYRVDKGAKSFRVTDAAARTHGRQYPDKRFLLCLLNQLRRMKVFTQLPADKRREIFKEVPLRIRLSPPQGIEVSGVKVQ